MPIQRWVVDQYADALELLRQAGRRALGFTPNFEPITANGAPGHTIAIDGSAAVLLDNGAVWVVAHRAAAVAGQGGPPAAPAITATLARDAADVVEQAWQTAGLPEPPRPRDAESFASALMQAAEVRAAAEAAADMVAGQMLLWDGAIHSTPIEERLVNIQRTLPDGASMLGIAKRSALAADGTPLVPALMRMGPDRPWQVKVPDTAGVVVARLHPGARHAFRVDHFGSGAAPLLGLSDDAVYTGYPYPLARAHNAVAITGTERAFLRAGLMDAAAEDEEVAALLADFHDILDANT